MPEVINNEARHQFEIRDGEQLGRLSYRLRDRVLELIHTEVPRPIEGRGYGDQLVHAALEYAARESLLVKPTCPFVQSYIKRHPQYSGLTYRTDD